MDQQTGSMNSKLRFVLAAAAVAAVVYFVSGKLSVITNILVAMVGFGAVVMVHEFGHFIVAKLSDIKVEAFSLFMPPTFLGVKRTEEGFRLRILPHFFRKPGTEPDAEQSRLSLTIGPKGKAGETEYRIGLFPFGGYVKMLGQEDTGPVKSSSDPRSFANKPTRVRIPVVAAGVTFNVLAAAVIFVTVFLVGIDLPPAVVGGVLPNSPAERAGLQAGDEFIEIAGDTHALDFSNIMIAAALSDANEAVPAKIRREDGSIRDVSLVAEMLPGGNMREFGILRPSSLNVAMVSDADRLFAETGLKPGDHVVAVDGQPVTTYWQLEQRVRGAIKRQVTLTVARTKPSGAEELVQVRVGLDLNHVRGDADSESNLSHVYSMVPRLRITIAPGVETALGKTNGGEQLQTDDVILSVGDVENPTYLELREVTQAYANRPLPLRVLRVDPNDRETELTVTVTPQRAPGTDRVMIGLGIALDGDHAVVAKTIETEGGPAKLDIPRGATITAVNGQPVSSFYDCIDQIKQWPGKSITLEYELAKQQTGSVTVDIRADEGSVAVDSQLAAVLPFDYLQREYRASGPLDALGMGYRRTLTFIAQTYVTLRRLVGGLISPKHLMGPVGILTFSYHIVAEQPLVYYAYFLGLINASIAVLNFLPMPPFDGGLIVLMLVEKAKGSALSERTQGVLAYAGWVLVGTLFLYVTFNDIVRSMRGFFS